MDFKRILFWMGHASVACAMDRSAHLLPQSHEATVGMVDAYMERADTASRLAVLDA